MRSTTVKVSVAFAMFALSAMAMVPRASATVQDGGMCWVPDVEFPVPCDDDDE
jgi:hypothetical protein